MDELKKFCFSFFQSIEIFCVFFLNIITRIFKIMKFHKMVFNFITVNFLGAKMTFVIRRHIRKLLICFYQVQHISWIKTKGSSEQRWESSRFSWATFTHVHLLKKWATFTHVHELFRAKNMSQVHSRSRADQSIKGLPKLILNFPPKSKPNFFLFQRHIHDNSVATTFT